MDWRKQLYGERASEKRYVVLMGHEGQVTCVPAGGVPVYEYERKWQEYIKVNRPLPAHWNEGAYKALARVLGNQF